MSPPHVYVVQEQFLMRFWRSVGVTLRHIDIIGMLHPDPTWNVDLDKSYGLGKTFPTETSNEEAA